MIRYKKLEKKMTYSEALEYVKNHRKYRLPKRGEIKSNETYWLLDKPTIIDGIRYAWTNSGMSNTLFKNAVYVVKRVSCEEDIIYSCSDLNKIISKHTNRKYLTKKELEDVLNKEMLGHHELLDVMTQDDLFRVK